jgi:hypothetical protein
MKRFASMVSALAILLSLAASMNGAALEGTVLTVAERGLSADIPSDFHVFAAEADANTTGIFSSDLMINSTDPEAGRIFLSIFSVYDDVMMRMSPSSLSDLFLSAEISAVESHGDAVVGNWSAAGPQGQNVTVYILETPDPRVSGGSYDMASWSLDGNVQVLMVSTAERNVTENLIGTLKIEWAADPSSFFGLK